MPGKIVLDASVIVKWFIEEELSEKALEVRERILEGSYEVYEPELMFLEVLNALKRKNYENIREAAKALILFGFKVIPITLNLLLTAVKITKETNLTVYDSIYLAIAKETSSILITADDKLAKFATHLKDL